MSAWLDTLGNSVLSIAICDRCKMKRAYSDISQDGNIPGLRVCNQGCSDQRDPYRLPARQPEKISLRFPRPDIEVAQTHNNILTDPTQVENPTSGGGEFTISTETPTNPLPGNLDGLSP
jgi:hypothetical protein